MANEPSLPDFQAAAVEVTSALPEPTRPEEVSYSRTGPGPDMVSMERWANDYDKAVQAHAQERQPELTDKQQAIMEAAEALAPRENPSAEQQLQQQQERDGR